MLLYTRIAPPKVPKRRSRAGCTFCKEKKKKCDEGRPRCSRCAERGLNCVYEAVKPRQRRRRTDAMLSNNSHSTSSATTSSAGRSSASAPKKEDSSLECGTTESVNGDIFSPLSADFDTSSLFGFDSGFDIALTSPIASSSFDLGSGLDFSEPVPEVDDGEEQDGDVFGLEDVSSAVVPSTRRQSSSEMSMLSGFNSATPFLELNIPSFIEFTDRPSRRALVDHFCSVMSHLIVFREERGNPFQQLILPLSHSSLPVMNALYALSSAHLEHRGVEIQEDPLSFHNMAIQGLAKLIEKDDKSRRNEMLAAIILLVYYEVLVQKGRSNIVDGHLKGAMTVINSAPEANDPTGVFLERAFRFYDVIAALSFGTAPLSIAPAAGYLAPFPPPETADESTLSNVDTLLGMATTLWPVMHRLSMLLALKGEMERAMTSHQTSKAAVMRTELESTSEAIEAALKQWQPTLPGSASVQTDDEDATDSQARLVSALNNSLAYRHSALVYLYRTIHGYPRGHHLVQTHAHVALTHCVATVSNAGPMGALLWPLFVAACEAISDSDRAMSRTAFLAVEHRQGMANIGRAWEIVQEVWRRADVLATTPGSPNPVYNKDREAKAGHIWTRVSQDMGVTIVFG